MVRAVRYDAFGEIGMRLVGAFGGAGWTNRRLHGLPVLFLLPREERVELRLARGVALGLRGRCARNN
jgi:hypothetical protein